MRRFQFDTVLVALNAADMHRLPFISTVVAEAVKQNMGVIAMKICAQKRLLYRLTMAEALGYVWSIPGVSLAIVGCETPTEVDENAELARLADIVILEVAVDAANGIGAAARDPAFALLVFDLVGDVI